MPAYISIKTYVTRLHKKMSLRRKKEAKPRPVISAPFNFKKEDNLGCLQGISSEELHMMRERATASIVGTAVTSPYPDSPPLPLSSTMRHVFPDVGHGHRLNRVSTSNSVSTMTTTTTNATTATNPYATTMAARRRSTSSRIMNSSSGRAYNQYRSYSATSAGGMSTGASSAGGAGLDGGRRLHHHHHHHHHGFPSRRGSLDDSLDYHPPVLASTEPYTPAGLTTPSSSSASSIYSFHRDRD